MPILLAGRLARLKTCATRAARLNVSLMVEPGNLFCRLRGMCNIDQSSEDGCGVDGEISAPHRASTFPQRQ